MTQQTLTLSPRPTALFAANNFIAIGAYRALGGAGLHVPDDIAMVAFDDLPPALILEPFLTVAAQPAYEMGQIATELLLARLSGHGAERLSGDRAARGNHRAPIERRLTLRPPP